MTKSILRDVFQVVAELEKTACFMDFLDCKAFFDPLISSEILTSNMYIIILLEFKENIYSCCYGRPATLVAKLVYCPLVPIYIFTSIC